MKPCPHCGKELPEEMQFCPYCMEKFVPETPVDIASSRRPPWWLWLTVFAVLVILISLAVWLWWPDGQPIPVRTIPAVPSTTENSTASTGEPTNPTDNSGIQTKTTESTTGTTKEKVTTSTTTEKATKSTTKTKKPTKTTVSTKSSKKTEPTSSKTSGKTSRKTNPTTSSSSAAPCANGHAWTDFLETVQHQEVGHYEEQATGSTRVTIYQCAICYQKHDSLTDYYTHFDAVHADTAPNINVFRDRYETDTEIRPSYEQVWVVDQAAYTETITVGRRCKRCGKTEENP